MEVVLAANGPGRTFLEMRFPQLRMLTDSPDLEVTYRKNLRLGLILDSPKFLKLISSEKRWLDNLQNIERFDLVISDNRYGLYHQSAQSVILTHQLNIEAGSLSKAANLMHHKLLENFDERWIPDDPNVNLAGGLSQAEVRFPVQYVGPLTRFNSFPDQVVKGRILCLVSGPEPMRSEFEEGLCLQMATYDDWKLLQGKPGNTSSHGQVIPHLGDNDLTSEISSAELIICRSGYSTLMDLHHAPCKLLIVPTPGQGEQESLAKHWASNSWATTCRKDELTNEVIQSALKTSRVRIPAPSFKLLDLALNQTLGVLEERRSISS